MNGSQPRDQEPFGVQVTISQGLLKIIGKHRNWYYAL